MEVFKVINSVVKELNCKVCVKTLLPGTQLVDIYSSPNECNVMVCSGSCGPVNSYYIGSVLVEYSAAESESKK